MDSIKFHEICSENKDKLCSVTLHNGSVHRGINRGVFYEGYGLLCMHLENKGKIDSFSHIQVESIYVEELA